METCEKGEYKCYYRPGANDPFVKISGKSVKLPPISPCIHRKTRREYKKNVVMKSLFTRLPLIPYSEREHDKSFGGERTKPHTPFFNFCSDIVKDYQL